MTDAPAAKDFNGHFEIDGETVLWRRMGVGFQIECDTMTGHIDGEPSEGRVRDFLAGYRRGQHDGRFIGRKELQHEARQLLGLYS